MGSPPNFQVSTSQGELQGASAAAHDKSVPVSPVKLRKAPRPKDPPLVSLAKPVWPKKATARVELSVQPGGVRRGHVVVGGLPVTVSAGSGPELPSGRMASSLAADAAAPSAVTVSVVDPSALADTGAVVGVQVVSGDGLAGPVHVDIDYSAFANAYGAGWSDRLGMVRLPDCVLSTPEVDDCRVRERLVSDNDSAVQTVAGDVDLNAVSPLSASASVDGQAYRSAQLTGEPARQTASVTDVADGSVVVALAAAASSQNGDFAKTSLSQSGSWQAGASAADFSWSYPISVPPVPGGLTPPVSIGYSSAAVDGKTANENEQVSWIGEGFDYQPGFIERSYRSCAADTTPTAPTWTDGTDSCWRMANATLSWGGHSTELIANDTSNPPNTAMPKVWHLADDDGTKVEYLSGGDGAITQNWNDERWRLTTKDGTQYWFGRSLIPATTTRTNSVLGMPVVSNHPGEPCYSASALSASWCSMAYRWNLDYVVDPHGNSIVYTYAKESNSAHKPGFATATQTYDRAGYLTKIEYGWRAGQEATPMGALVAAPARVLFTVADRCWSSTCGTHDGTNWPDTPWDLYCGSGGPCDGPTFWTTQRLTKVESQVWTGTPDSYRSVDVYDLDSTVPSTGHGGGGKALSLQGITHTGADSGPGRDTPSIALKEVYFGYGVSLQNRALFDPNSGAPDAWRYRLQDINTESGGHIHIAYQAVDSGCVYPTAAPNPDTNYRRCFPQYYTDNNNPSNSGWTWWHKYIVASVTESDDTGASPTAIVHNYTYQTSAPVGPRTIGTSSVLWAHDRNAYASTGTFRSWNRWAGYPLVTTTVGSGGPSDVSKTMNVYYTGLDGDTTDTGVRNVALTDTEGVADQDYWYRAGRLRESITFDGNSTTVLAKTITDNSATQTGTRSIDSSWATNYLGAAMLAYDTAQNAYTWIAGTGSWRRTYTAWTHDGFGNITITDAQGDTATDLDDTCTTNTYLTNTTANLRRYDGTGPSTVNALPTVMVTDWSGYDLTIPAGDFNGDGKNDIIARRPSDGTLWLYPGNGTGGFGTAVMIGSSGWNGFTSLLAADLTGDGKPDIVGNGPDGTLKRFTNTGGALAAATQIGSSGWAAYELFSPGDFSGDAKPDVLGVNTSTGTLVIWTGTGTGGVSNTGIQIGGSGWDLYRQVFGGDYTGDGKPDLLAADEAGLWIFAGNGASGYAGRVRMVTGLIGLDADQWVAAGDITGDGKPDIVTRQFRYLAAVPSKTTTVGVKCATTPAYPDNAVSASQMFVDQPGAASPNPSIVPTVGDVTRTDAADKYNVAIPNWVKQSETIYDSYGRPTTVKDPLGNATNTAYTETNGLTTQITVTDPLNHQTTTTLAVGRGLPVTVTDPNGKKTTGSYDALGRLLEVWKPGNSTTTPDAAYVYNVDGVAPPSVTSKMMAPDGSQVTSYEILDGLLHTRQTQTPTADGGRAITDTQYDNRGLTVKTSAYYNSSPPSSTLEGAADTAVDSQHRFTYDGLGRQLSDQLWSRNAVQFDVSATSYDGDRTTVDNALGGIDTTTVVDALGRTSELRQYQSFAEYQDLVAVKSATTGKTNMTGIKTGTGRRTDFSGQGNNTFTSSTGTSTGWDTFRDWTAGEYSGDGKQDLVGIRKSDGALFRYLGDGELGFTSPAQIGTGWSDYRDLAGGDFNGDGKGDLVAIRISDGMARFWSGTGTGTFNTPVDLASGWSGYKHLVAGDVDGNGKLDLLAIRSSDGMLMRWWGNGNGTFGTATALFAGWGSRVNLAAGDFNGDGKADLFGAVSGDPTLKRWTGDGTTFASIGPLPITQGQGYDSTTYSYDHAGNLTDLTGPDSAHWHYDYDKLGRKTTTSDPDSGTSTTTYDEAGHVKTTTDARNQVLVYKYDSLGRKFREYKDSESAANQLAEWTYDPVGAIGQLAAATRYVGGNQVGGYAYVQKTTAFDDGYRPLHTDLIIPANPDDPTALAGTYGTDYAYKTNGAPATVTATTKSGTGVGGLPLETLTYGYNSIGQPTSLASGTQTYQGSIAYSYDGQIAQQILGNAGKQVRQTLQYDTATRRLSTSQVDTENQTTPGTWDTYKAVDQYSWDNAGNLQAIIGATNGSTDQVQCFDYDSLRHLTEAWTEATWTCNSTNKQKTGADPYRLSWTIDAAGNRKTETGYNADGSIAYASTYNYGPTGHTHALATVTTTGTGAGTNTYAYDAVGNTTSRPGPGGAQQTLTWDPEGHLSKVTDSSDTTFVYDADGARLIRRDPGGYTTLTLTDGTELRANSTGPVVGTRYYGGVATRTANVDTSGSLDGTTTLTWNITDNHGTGNLVISSSTMQVDHRRSLPYGQPLGTQATGFGNKGFVGGTSDPTGLTHLGAREYDPTTGRFLSIDPIFDGSDPQSWNGYAYANNAPITASDPSGMVRYTDFGIGGAGGAVIARVLPNPFAGARPAAAVVVVVATLVLSHMLAKSLAQKQDRIDAEIDARDAASSSGGSGTNVTSGAAVLTAALLNKMQDLDEIMDRGDGGATRTTVSLQNGRWLWSDGSIRDKSGRITYSPPGTGIEGEKEVIVYDPSKPSDAITDIDEVKGGVLWEDKSPVWATDNDAWVKKQVIAKLNKYLKARSYIPGMEDAPIGLRLTSPISDSSLRAAIEKGIEQFRHDHPTVDVRLDFK